MQSVWMKAEERDDVLRLNGRMKQSNERNLFLNLDLFNNVHLAVLPRHSVCTCLVLLRMWTNMEQAFVCFLCFFNFGFKKQDRETCTQTDDTLDETQQQVTRLLLLLHISTYDPSYYYYLYYFEHVHSVVDTVCLEIELTIFWTTVSKVSIGWFKLVISCFDQLSCSKIDWTGLTSWYPVSCFSERSSSLHM